MRLKHFLILPLFIASTAMAATPSWFSVHQVKANDSLNMRAAPDADSGKLGALPYNGKCLKNLGCVTARSKKEYLAVAREERKARRGKPVWCLVEFNGKVGWASRAYLKADNCHK